MKPMRMFVFAAVLTGLAGWTLAARDGDRTRRRGRKPQVSLAEQILAECKLTDKQKADLKERVKARDAVLAEWDKANAKKVETAEAAAKDARTKQDAEARKKAASELRQLKTARQESAAQTTAGIIGILTPKQRLAWETFQLYTSTVNRYRRAELTEEQLAKVKVACGAAAKELGEIDENESKPKKIIGAVNQKLRWAIDVLVLTPQQREALAKKPEPRKK
ncbi:MAG: hypothetical protein QGG42_18400 [Phycisphaerae bacterium]|jgi:Spy/CpxP family protein refolding chaperone|nr:hypothetical protein [Phycisphaerae bacterium]